MMLNKFVELVRRTADTTRTSLENEKLILEAYNAALTEFGDKHYKHYLVVREFELPSRRAGTFDPVLAEPFKVAMVAGTPLDSGLIPFLVAGEIESNVEYVDTSGVDPLLHLVRQVPSTYSSTTGHLYIRGIDLSITKCDVVIGDTVQEYVSPAAVFSVGTRNRCMPVCQEYEQEDTPAALTHWYYISPRIYFKNPLLSSQNIEVKFYRQPVLVDTTDSYDITKIPVDFPVGYEFVLASKVAAIYLAFMNQPDLAEYKKQEIADRLETLDSEQRGMTGTAYTHQRRGLYVRSRRFT